MSNTKDHMADLDGLIGLDRRSLIKLGNSAVVSIPEAQQLGLVGNIDELDAAVTVRKVDDEIVVEARISLR